MHFQIGDILDGTVTGITSFGAFVSLPEGKNGLVHISEVSSDYVQNVNEYLSVGQAVRVKVIAFTPEGKISLSIKRAAENSAAVCSRQAASRSSTQRTAYRSSANSSGSPGTGAVRRNESSDSAGQGYAVSQQEGSTDPAFEDKLKKFLQLSDSKISENPLYEKQRRSSKRRK